MYSLMSKISQTISNPVTDFLHSFEHFPIVVALLLGLIGAAAPCQLTGNLSAITFYGNRTIQMKGNWGEIISFIVGKIVVFSLIGLLAWIFGRSFETKMTEFFPIFRKAIGPLMMVTGLVLLGIFKFGFINRLTMRIPLVLKEGKLGSFLLGASFSLAFCPTMFILFFVWLMPTVLSTSYGFVLPAVFGFATSLPLILLFILIWLFDARQLIMKKSMKLGKVIQNLAGIIILMIGLFDTITYWEI